MFIVSEISPQFGTDLDLAERMIIQSKFAGANAVKLQLYPAELFHQTPSEYLRDRELSFDEFERLKSYGDRIGIPVFATAFTPDRLQWCKELDQDYYKIAARMHGENPELVEAIISMQRTTFVSYPHDYDVSRVRDEDNCINLYCVVRYPTLLESVSLPDFRRSIYSGFSDHTIGISAAIYAAAHGCRYLEKHFTISHARQATNELGHAGAMTVEELSELKRIVTDFERLGRTL